MRRLRTLIPTLIALTVLLQGCLIVTDGDGGDPRGVSVALQASWQIDGAPADFNSCQRAGIDRIQLVFVDDSNELRYPDFLFECEDGAYLGTGDLRRGTFSAFWESQDASGNAIEQSDVIAVDADNVDDIALTDIPNFTSTLVASSDVLITPNWDVDIDSSAFSGASCAGVLGLNAVGYELVDVTGGANTLVKAYPVIAGCQDQILVPQTDIVIGNNYRLDVLGGPSDGAWYWQKECFFTPVDGGTQVSCDIDDVRFRMSVGLAWDKDISTQGVVGTTCADAGVATMSYELRIRGGAVVATESNVACENALIFEEPLVNADDTYELVITGSESGGGNQWDLICSPLTADTGVMDNGICDVERG